MEISRWRKPPNLSHGEVTAPAGAGENFRDIALRIPRHHVEAMPNIPLERCVFDDVPPVVECNVELFPIAKRLRQNLHILPATQRSQHRPLRGPIWKRLILFRERHRPACASLASRRVNGRGPPCHQPLPARRRACELPRRDKHATDHAMLA